LSFRAPYSLDLDNYTETGITEEISEDQQEHWRNAETQDVLEMEQNPPHARRNSRRFTASSEDPAQRSSRRLPSVSDGEEEVVPTSRRVGRTSLVLSAAQDFSQLSTAEMLGKIWTKLCDVDRRLDAMEKKVESSSNDLR
jgi:hypothetical protein